MTPEYLISDIDLRWTLRDIKARRFLLLPIDPRHMEELLRRGWVEMRGDVPVVTDAGMKVIDPY